MGAYLDSSAAVKLFLVDEGVALDLAAMFEAFGSVATSQLTYVETRSALAAGRRSGRLSVDAHDSAVRDLELAWRTLFVVDLSGRVVREAGDAAETFGLRAGDAVQLASLRSLQDAGATLVAWDARLRAAATASGFACYPPEI